MAMARYCVTAPDHIFIRQYLHNKIQAEAYPCPASHINANQSFQSLDENNADALNTWCETYLCKQQWRQLKGALRSHRSRQNTPAKNKKRSTNISPEASTMLSYLAAVNQTTISEVLVKHLSKPYFIALDAGAHCDGDADLQDELRL